MPLIKTIKELKEDIKDLPDDMPIEGYNGHMAEIPILTWIQDEDANGDDLPPEEHSYVFSVC